MQHYYMYMLAAFQQIDNKWFRHSTRPPSRQANESRPPETARLPVATEIKQNIKIWLLPLKIQFKKIIRHLYEGDIITNPSYINYGIYHPWLRLVLLKESPSLSQLCDHLVIPALTKNEYSIMAVLVVLDKNNCYIIAYLTYLYRSHKLYSIFIL